MLNNIKKTNLEIVSAISLVIEDYLKEKTSIIEVVAKELMSINVNDTERIVSYGKVHLVNWYLVLESDYGTVFDNVHSNVYIHIMLYLLSMVIFITILYFFLSKMLHPLQQLQNGFN